MADTTRRLWLGVTSVTLLLIGPTAWTQEEWGCKDDKIKLTQKVYTAGNVPETPKIDDLALTDTVTQYGITWTFAEKARIGRYLTGDYYVVGPVTIKTIDPKPLFGGEVTRGGWKIINRGRVEEEQFKDKWCRNGSTLNQPVGKDDVGCDSRMPHGRFDPRQVARLPISMKPGDALVSSISNPDERLATSKFSGHSRVLTSMAILTCMHKPQPIDAFRPSYCDRKQTIYLARNLKRELLRKLPKPASTPKLDEWIRRTHRPWLDIIQFNYATAEENQPRYGQWFTWMTSNISLMLHLDFEPEQKEALLIHFVQYGIDLWGVVRAGHSGWLGHGGFGGGRKWPILFAGLMLADADMQKLKTLYPKVMFGEDTQTAAGKSWTGHDVVFTSHPINLKKGTWKVSPDTMMPELWVSLSNEGYRRCCTSRVWPGQALAIRMMKAEKLWSHDPWLAHVDRWMTEDHRGEMKRIAERLKKNKAVPQRFAAVPQSTIKRYEERAAGSRYDLTYPFMLAMWKKYRPTLDPPPTTPKSTEPVE